MLRCLLVLIGLTLGVHGAFASDEPDLSVVEVRVRYTMNCNTNQCTLMNDLGSAVCVGEFDGKPVFATCHHVVKKHVVNRAIPCDLRIGGNSYPANCIGYSERLDLALLVAHSVVPRVQQVAIEETPELTGDIVAIGFPTGRFTKLKAKLKARWKDPKTGVTSLVTDHPTSTGQSGGGIFRNNNLAGIVWGTGENQSYCVPGDDLAKMCRHFKVKLKAKLRSDDPFVMPLPPPPPENSPPVVVPNDPNTSTQLQSLLLRLEAIEGKLNQQGPAIPGPAGPMGPSGPIGPRGSDADVEPILKRLTMLEQRGIKVELLDANGVVVSTQRYAPGAPIRLQFNPVKRETAHAN